MKDHGRGDWLAVKDLLDSNPPVSTPNSLSRRNKVVRLRKARGRCVDRKESTTLGRRKGVILTGNWWKESSLRIVDDTSGFEAGN